MCPDSRVFQRLLGCLSNCDPKSMTFAVLLNVSFRFPSTHFSLLKDFLLFLVDNALQEASLSKHRQYTAEDSRRCDLAQAPLVFLVDRRAWRTVRSDCSVSTVYTALTALGIRLLSSAERAKSCKRSTFSELTEDTGALRGG